MRSSPKVLAGCAFLVLLVGCGGDRPPRHLPFPSFDPRSPFPEFAGTETAGPAVPEQSAFARALGGAAERGKRVDRKPPGQSLALGNGLGGELPEEAWTWAADPGLTLAVHRGPAGIDTLIYTEPFSAQMQSNPSEEIRRFHRTIVPERVEDLLDPHHLRVLAGDSPVRRIARGTGSSVTDAARLVQLLATRTAGRGLGFRPGHRESTGWRWVGRNGHGVTLRLSRVAGTWGPQRNLPADLARALARLPQAVPELAQVAGHASESGTAAAPGGPAYLLIGSVTDELESAGTHLAVLCATTPRCQPAEDLAAFLGSIQIGDPARLERLRDSQGAPADLAREAGMEILPQTETVAPDAFGSRGALAPDSL